jgi:hypothetical protein
MSDETSALEARWDRAVRWSLFVGALAALYLAQRSVGFARDESVYFEAGRAYARWWVMWVQSPRQAFSDASISRFFQFNAEHPVLMKTLFGWSHRLFHETLHVLPPAAAFRLPSLVITAAFLPLLYTLGQDVWGGRFGRAVGLFAALSFLLVPRQLFNGVLACFDMPVAFFWTLTVFCFLRAQKNPRWVLWTGGAFALALCAKHNALFLPFVLTPFALLQTWRRSAPHPAARRTAVALLGLAAACAAAYGFLALLLQNAFTERFELLSPQAALFVGLVLGSAWLLRELYRIDVPTFCAAAPLFAMIILGPVGFYLHWPYLWHHPVDRAAWYLAFHAKHDHYAWFYLGTLLRTPPFPLTYVVVKTALTVPTSLFVPMVAGYLAASARAVVGPFVRRLRGLSFEEWVVLANATASIAVISHPQVPHFGGVKHWLPSMPFLSLLAGTVVVVAAMPLAEWAARWKPTSRLPAWASQGVLAALVLLPALITTVHLHPYGTAAYSELAGGVPGAASMGMQRQFWSSQVTGVLPWINAHAPERARLYLHEVMDLSFRHYQENGLLRADLQLAHSPSEADFSAYQYHQEFREQEMNMWQAYGTQKPKAGLYIDETPQILVYGR